MNLGSRIKFLREEQGLTQVELANLSGISRASIQLYEAEKVNIPVKNLAKIAKVLSVDVDYFLSSNYNFFVKQEQNLSSKMSSNVKQPDKVSLSSPLVVPKSPEMSLSPNDLSKQEKMKKIQDAMDNLKTKHSMVNLRLYRNVSASAGYGANNDDEDFEIVPVSSSFLTNILKVPAREYDVISVFGDSMEPFLKNGDMVLVDRISEAKNGNIIIANFDGELYVKKLIKDPILGDIRLTSLNDFYKDIEIKSENLEQLNIVGIVTKKIPINSF